MATVALSQRSHISSELAVSNGLSAGVYVLSVDGEVLECDKAGAQLLARDRRGRLVEAWSQPQVLAAVRAGVASSSEVDLGGLRVRLHLMAQSPSRLLAVTTLLDGADARRLGEPEPARRGLWLEQAPAMVAVLDPDGAIAAASHGLCRRLGITNDEVVGCSLCEFVHPHDRPALAAQLAAAQAEDTGPASADLRLLADETVEAACQISVLQTEDGEPVGACVMLWDIGDRKRVERDLEAYTHDLEQLYIQLERRSEELERANQALAEARVQTLHAEELARIEKMKSAFLDVAAHELRTPVTLLTGLLDCLSGDMPPSVRDNLMAAAQRSAARLANILNTSLKLLESGQPDYATQFRPRCLRRLLEDAAGDVRSFVELRNQELVVEVSESLPNVTVDVSMMRDVVANLLMNAIKFSPDGGRITITAGLAEDGEHCWFAVKDNGIGIPDADRPFIFNQFFGTLNTAHHSSGNYEYNTRGPGFGLAVVRKFVEMHRGRIELESKPNQGSCFTVYLPLRRTRV